MPALFLLMPGLQVKDAVTILGTNKMSSICGTSAALIQYARHIRIPWTSAGPAALAAFLFSFLGALAVSRIPTPILRPLVLALLVLVAVYTFWRKDMGAHHKPRFQGRQALLPAAICGGAIGFYDGFFGPGTGSFLVFIFIGLFGFDFLTASASAKVINAATNLSALLFFAASGRIYYAAALPMGLCNVLGALAGAKLAILRGNRFVRPMFLLVVTAMILRYGWEVLAR